jgi:hypothetical protein
MLMQYVKLEEIDDVLTLTFAQGPGESGFILNVMRPVPGSDSGAFEPELETYTLVTGDQDCICEGGIHEWSMDGRNLTLSLTDEAAQALGIDRTQSFELAAADDEIGPIRDALELALSPVGFPGLSRLHVRRSRRRRLSAHA